MDSKPLYDAIAGINATTEKRLLIDLTVPCEAYELQEIGNLVWIPTADNLADALTKSSATLDLLTLMEDN